MNIRIQIFIYLFYFYFYIYINIYFPFYKHIDITCLLVFSIVSPFFLAMILFLCIYSLIAFMFFSYTVCLSNNAQTPWLQTTEVFTECLCLNRYSIAPYSVLEQCGIKHPKPSPFFGNLMMFRDVRAFVYFIMKPKTHSLTFSHVRTLYRPLEAREIIFLSVSLTSLDMFIKDDSPLMTCNAIWFPNRLPSVLNDVLLQQ